MEVTVDRDVSPVVYLSGKRFDGALWRSAVLLFEFCTKAECLAALILFGIRSLQCEVFPLSARTSAAH